MNYIYIHNQALVKKIHEPVFEKNQHKLSLANHSLKQLNILNEQFAPAKIKFIPNPDYPLIIANTDDDYNFINQEGVKKAITDSGINLNKCIQTQSGQLIRYI